MHCYFKRFLSAVYIYNHIYMMACLNVMWELEGEEDNVNVMLVDLSDIPVLIFISSPVYDIWTWPLC